MVEYRIDDLARAAGTTVRNVRVYQDRGLLPPPRREGRTGIYGEPHLARLRLIGQLLERGYTFAHIGEFLEAWQRGRNLSDLLGLEQVLTTPWSDEVDDYVNAEQLVERFGEISDTDLETLLAQELLVRDGDRYRVPSPRLLHAGSELVRAGLPLSVVLELSGSLAKDMEASAKRLVDAVTAHAVLPRASASDASMTELAELITHLKPLAQLAVDAHLARAMEQQVRQAVEAHMQSAADGPAAAS
ncbi:MAG: transcriptional regulator, MerR family [Frankiales bacterium]|nr:transcriptional regulator, MerR family [Frankiales bacterium]